MTIYMHCFKKLSKTEIFAVDFLNLKKGNKTYQVFLATE